MESLFLSNEEFFEGEVFAPTEQEFLRIRKPGPKLNASSWPSQSRVAATARKLLLAAAIGAATMLAANYTTPVNASMTPAWTIEVMVPREGAPDPGRFSVVRKALVGSQRKAAAVLHVSESALEQFEQGRVEPGRAFAARYWALVELDELLTKAFGRDEELRSAYLHGHGEFFGGRPPLEWAAQSGSPDAITEVKSVFSRTLS